LFSQKPSCAPPCIIPPGKRRCRVISNKDCCEGSCVHQGLSGSGLRRVDSLHVACWIRSSSSGCVHRVIGRLSIWLTRCERSGQNYKDHRRDPYHVVSDYWVDHRECFLLICGLFLLRTFFRSVSLYWRFSDRIVSSELNQI
jgi:hypothetical protein